MGVRLRNFLSTCRGVHTSFLSFRIAWEYNQWRLSPSSTNENFAWEVHFGYGLHLLFCDVIPSLRPMDNRSREVLHHSCPTSSHSVGVSTVGRVTRALFVAVLATPSRDYTPLLSVCRYLPILSHTLNKKNKKNTPLSTCSSLLTEIPLPLSLSHFLTIPFLYFHTRLWQATPSPSSPFTSVHRSSRTAYDHSDAEVRKSIFTQHRDGLIGYANLRLNLIFFFPLLIQTINVIIVILYKLNSKRRLTLHIRICVTEVIEML